MMPSKKTLTLIASTLVLTLLPLLALAAPPTQAQCAGNLLVNPGFEDGFSERGAGEVTVANGWDPWWHNGSPDEVNSGFLRRPEYKGEDARVFTSRRVHSGTFSQKWFTTFSTHAGGIFQRVAVPTGSQATFSAWVQVWSSQDPNPDTVVNPGNYRVSVGIDPTGGTDGDAGTVVWSDEVVQYNTWIQLTVSAKAQAGAITVFLRGRPEYRNQFNDSYWDDTCLTIVKPTPRATNTPKPTATPTETPVPPTPTPTATPAVGSISLLAYLDANGNRQQDQGEELAPGVQFMLETGTGDPLDTYTTDGRSEPKAYEQLPPGDYLVTAQPPEGYIPAGVEAWSISLSGGSGFTVKYAVKFAPTATPTRTPIPTRTPTATPTPLPEPAAQTVGSTLYGISGLLTLALAVGLSVGLYLRRKQK